MERGKVVFHLSSPLEQTKVVVEAAVDGVRGLFVVDTGAPILSLNRTFLQPNPKGGVELATAGRRLPERNVENLVNVAVELGAIQVVPAAHRYPKRSARPFNAELDHEWGNYAWVFAPRLGNLSLSVIEPFETIVDYRNRRVVLIALDPAGHRVVDVPAYAPRWKGRLIDLPPDEDGMVWWALGVRPDDVLDTADPTRNTVVKMFDTGNANVTNKALGYPFLSALGAFGLNHRTHEFILYR